MTHIIRTSDRKTFKECRQRWDFGSKIRQDYEPNVESQFLTFGTAIHAALEVWYDPDTWHMPKEPIESIAFAAFLEAYKLDKNSSDERILSHKEELDLGEGMLQAYFKLSQQTDTFTPVYTEIEFEVPIPVPKQLGYPLPKDFDIHWFNDEQTHQLFFKDEPVVYQGRIDLIVQDRNGNYWIWDHKTAKSLSASTQHLEMDQQCGSYMWAIQQQLGIKIQGVVYNELAKQVPKPPKLNKTGSLSVDKRQNTTYDLFLAEIQKLGHKMNKSYAEMLEYLKEFPKEYIRRTVVPRSQAELEILGTNIFYEAIDMLNNPSIYPNPSRNNCDFCSYRTPCLNKMEGSDPTWIFNESYHKRKEVTNDT